MKACLLLSLLRCELFVMNKLLVNQARKKKKSLDVPEVFAVAPQGRVAQGFRAFSE